MRTADFEDDDALPEGWPPAPHHKKETRMANEDDRAPLDDGDNTDEQQAPVPVPTTKGRKRRSIKVPGFVELTLRETGRRHQFRLSAMLIAAEPLNPKNGATVVCAGSAFEVEESYDQVCAIMAETIDTMLKGERGY